MSIEAVLFDWGGTVTPWHTIDADALWLAAAGSVESAAALLAAEKAVWVRARDEHRSATLAEVFATAGVELTPEILSAYEAGWDPHTYADPDAETVFKGLRERGIRVGVLSNTIWARDHHERIFRRDGLLDLIDGAVYTSEIPWTKPHPEAFAASMAAVGVSDPARCVFVGDRLFDDVHGAQSVGMRTIYVPHSEIPVEQIGHTEGRPDATITRLGDILGVVEGWI